MEFAPLLEAAEHGDRRAFAEYDQAGVDAQHELERLPVSVGSKIGKAALKGPAAIALFKVAPTLSPPAVAQVGGALGEVLRPSAAWATRLIDAAAAALKRGASQEARDAAASLRARLTHRPGVFIAHLARADRDGA